MFRGSNRPSRKQIFGPSSTGGGWADARQDQLYMRGEGLGSWADARQDHLYMRGEGLGSWADARQDHLYMRGEGLGSFIGSMFRKIVPAATKTFKKIAGSKFVRDSGKQLLDGGINAMATVAADAISGDKDISQSVSEQVKNARKEISSSIRKANKRRQYSHIDTAPTKRIRKKNLPKARKKQAKYDIFDDDE